jgi:hypothetical protein
MELRLILLMDKKDVLVRGWREALVNDTAAAMGEKQ